MSTTSEKKSPQLLPHDEVHADKAASVSGTIGGSRVQAASQHLGGDFGTTPTSAPLIPVAEVPQSVSSGGGGNSSFTTLEEAMARHVTELDLAAYGKDEFTETMEQNMMHRMFSSFDVTQHGKLDGAAFREMLEYLRQPSDDPEVVEILKVATEGSGVTFGKFWAWWQKREDDTTKAFSIIESEFAVPYHQQQLLIQEEGEKFTPSYRCNFLFKDLETGQVRQVSPWHDIPLRIRDLVRTAPESSKSTRYNFICEIPKWTRAKFEIATKERFNPIKQDMKNGIPRFYKHGDMMWNYGAFPQTWESTEVEFLPGVKGDNDPLDAIEIGMVQFKTGDVRAVRILGVLGMLDDGEMDWKVICISVEDPLSKFLRDIDDVPKYLPGCLDAIREWLRTYKICQGGTENKFAFDGEFKDKAFAMNVIYESHLMWSKLTKINKKSTV